MAAFGHSDRNNWQDELLTFAIGVASGVAGGALVFKSGVDTRKLSRDFRSHAGDVARRLRPSRLRRLASDQTRLDQLEEDVLDAFRADAILSERAIDIGAISQGIVELSGWVNSADESVHAVEIANRVPGVRTVLNRMAVEQPYQKSDLRRTLDEGSFGAGFSHSESRVGGMGRRRQGAGTDPDRDDDSQRMSESALAAADRDQWSREGFAHTNSRMDSTPEVQAVNRTRYRDDELDNQNPRSREEMD